jgi:Tfp pilus assembly protein PilV
MSHAPGGWILPDSLAALLLLATAAGGLGLAVVQAMQQQREGVAWAQALQLSDDLLARMAIQREGLDAYRLGPGELPIEPDCIHRPCDATEWAQADLAAWKRRVQAELPQGDAQVTRALGDARQILVWLSWSAAPTGLAVTAPQALEVPTCPAGKRCHAIWAMP